MTGAGSRPCTRIIGNKVQDCIIEAGGTAAATAGGTATPETDTASAGVQIVLILESRVPGSGHLVRHVERTSVFSRPAASRQQHPGARSLTELAAMDAGALEAADEAGIMAAFGPGASLTAELLGQFSTAELGQLRDAQRENLTQIQGAVANIDNAISQARPSHDILGGFWASIPFVRTNLERAQNLGADLRDAETTAALEEVRGELESLNRELLNDNLRRAFRSLSRVDEESDEQKLRREALRMKAIDRLTLLSQAQNPPEEGQEAIQTQGQILREQIENPENSRRQSHETEEAFASRRAREQRLLQLYDDCDLGRVLGGSRADGTDVDLGDESNDFKALQYTIDCLDFCTSKLLAKRAEETTTGNISLIDDEIGRRGE